MPQTLLQNLAFIFVLAPLWVIKEITVIVLTAPVCKGSSLKVLFIQSFQSSHSWTDTCPTCLNDLEFAYIEHPLAGYWQGMRNHL